MNRCLPTTCPRLPLSARRKRPLPRPKSPKLIKAAPAHKGAGAREPVATAIARGDANRPADEPPAAGKRLTPRCRMARKIADDELLVGQETRPVIDLAARLADPLPGLQLKRTPLADFCDFLARLSTVPITLDTEALAAAGVRVTDAISISAADTTVGDASRKC